MRSLPEIHPRIKPGPDRRPPAPRRAVDPHQLDPAARRAFEESLKAKPGLKGRSMLVLLVLLDIARGKPWGFPSDEYVAGKAGVSPNTIWRALRDLVGLEVIRIVKARGRRWIILVGHPFAAEFVAGLEPAEVPSPIAPDPSPGADPQVEVVDPQVETAAPQVGGQSVLVKRTSESRDPAGAEVPVPAPARAEISFSGLNETTTSALPRPASTPRPTSPTSRRPSGIPDLAEAPADDPVIARELARRACARESTAAIPSRDEILAAVLGGATGDAPEADPAPEGHQVGADVHDAPPALDPEAATIEALSRLGPGATRGEILSATLRLTALFRDPGSRAFYSSVCNEVARGRLPARVPIAAVGSARGPEVRNPGAAFTAHLKRARAATAARRVSSGGIPPADAAERLKCAFEDEKRTRTCTTPASRAT
jgi:hypothetical protein